MPGTTIGIKMNNGYAGTVSRTADTIIQNRIAKENIAFGQAVVLNTDNTWSPVGASLTADAVAGIACREVVQANTFNPQSNPDYLANTPCDVVVRGQVCVRCGRGTPSAGGAVYIRTALNKSYEDAKIGDFEAADDTGKVVKVPNIEWTSGEMDANNIAEVTIKTRAKG